MECFEWRSHLPHPAQSVAEWHQRPGAFERLVPPWQDLKLITSEGVHPGARAEFRLGLGPLQLPWHAAHEALDEGLGFVDTQARGPFRNWRHEHRFLPDGESACWMDDRITYALPVRPIGQCIAGRHVRNQLQAQFAYRHRRLANDLDRHLLLPEPRTIAITGASGLVGRALTAFLTTAGHRVLRLVRRTPGPDEVQWQPSKQEIDAEALEGVHAVVHLAGESISGGRWTAERKQRIRDSRVHGTTLLARALAGLKRPPAVLVSTSAIGWYGDRQDERCNEDSAPGEGFLAEVSREWEAAADTARDAGIRVVHPRIGIVLSAQGGALAEMLPIFRKGAGGPLGSGQQGVSWIHIDDLVALIHYLIARDDLQGPFNAVAPAPVPQAEFATSLGRVIRRPAWIPAPAIAIRALMGEMGERLLLEGAFIHPKRLSEAGFTWSYPDLPEALRWATGCLTPEERQP